MFTAPSGAASTCIDEAPENPGAGVIAEDWVSEGAGRLTSGWVCCIFTVALGIAGFAPLPSAGRVMRAVSFFGAAAFIVTGAAWIPLPAGIGALGAPLGAGAGLSGTVGRAPSAGGFGGRFTPLMGLAGGKGMPACEGGRGGGGAKGFVADGGGGGADGNAGAAGAAGAGTVSASPVTIFVVSFFGDTLGGGAVGAGFPGRLMRTVSRFTVVGWSGFGGSVMRIVSAFDASSSVPAGEGGSSSDIG